jgi:hypothetical protein
MSKGNDKKAKASTNDDSTTKSEAAPKAASNPSEGPSKLEGNAPSNYSRGEKQKPVTGPYKENWNRIFGKKKAKRSR